MNLLPTSRSTSFFFKTCLSLVLIQCFVLIQLAFAGSMTDEAAFLFDQSKHSVFQIRVIDLATDEKSTTGSGFFISREGHITTNYHVVSAYVLKPENYRIEYIKPDGTTVDLQLLYFDIVHDLAILSSSVKTEHFLLLEQSDLPKGERIFSMGNPHDLGMTIIEGTFNGLMEKSQYRKILFSGSLNPGMSGGPALNHNGGVIGVNVSTLGNDVSFLVPVDYLQKLYDKVKGSAFLPVTEWEPLIEEQLLENQDHFIAELIESQWEHMTLGNFQVPGKIAPPFKCWGKTHDKEKNLVHKVQTNCSTEDYIFLSDEIYTSYYSFWFLYHKSKGISPIRLYTHLQSDFKNAYSFKFHDKENFTKFQCHTDFVEVADKTWKTVLCARQYKKFKSLYDIEFITSTVGDFDQGHMGELSVQGISHRRALDLVRKFMGSIK